MEIIKRTSETEKQTVSTRGYNEKMQVSLNNYGHIVLRFWSDAVSITTCKVCGNPLTWYEADQVWQYNFSRWCNNDTNLLHVPDKSSNASQETLIVLDQSESSDLVNFIQQRVK